MTRFPHEIANAEQLIAMLERVVSKTGDSNAQSLIQTLRQNPALAEHIFEQFYTSRGMEKGISRGFLDQLSLSSLPFVAISQLQAAYPLVLRRLSVHAPSIVSIRLVIAPSMEFEAKMHLGMTGPVCYVSVGLIVTVLCATVCLVCRSPGFKSQPSLRTHLHDAYGVTLSDAKHARSFCEQFRCADTLPFAEETELLRALGITAEEINHLLAKADCRDLILALLVANEAIRFFVLHEIAHFEEGHTHLFKYWIDAPDDASAALETGFPSENARRAMESIADAWAVEMTVVSAMYRECSFHDAGLYERRPTPLQRTHIVIAATELAFLVMGAADTVQSDRSALLQTLGDALLGNVRDMYPGFGARSAFAVPTAIRRLTRNYPYLRWTRWWQMRKELSSVDTQSWALFMLMAWHSAGLGGHLPTISDRQLQPDFSWFTRRTEFKELEFELSNGDAPHRIGFDYVRHHRPLVKDLQAAQKWCSEALRARA